VLAKIVSMLGLYWVVGPVACALLCLSMFAGRKRMMLLQRRAVLPIPPPSVTILIPAKDEEQRIAQCLESVLRQDYPRFDIIAINDRSEDRTGSIMDTIANTDPRLSILHVPHGALPAGWTGKCHALHLAWQQAKGDWIFFVDSDVLLTPSALTMMMTQAAGREYDFLSVLTRLECYSWWERLILPLAAGAVSMMYAVSLTNNDAHPTNAFANGQAMLVRRDVYGSVGGHEAVKHLITEDVELARLLKSNGHKVRLAWGGDIASTRMYSNVGQMFRGWGRIYSGLSRRRPWRIVTAIAFLLVGMLSAYPILIGAIVAHNRDWAIASGVHVAVVTLMAAFIYRWSGNPTRYAIAFPFGGAAVLALLTFALKWCITGKVEWRGTSYATPTAG
jgi:chlorobactene glucosyltransferase